MRVFTKNAVAAVAIGLCAVAVPSAAHAGSKFASQRVELREACLERGGVFRRMWVYDDQGVKRGETLSCATGAGTITCRNGVCRVGSSSRSNGSTTVTAGTASANRTESFPAEIQAFSAVLSALSAN